MDQYTKQNQRLFDAAAWQPVTNSILNSVVKEMNQGIPTFNNRRGAMAMEKLASFRQTTLDLLHISDIVHREVVIFPSGTLANTQFLSGAINRLRKEGKERIRVVVSAVEHPSITYWCETVAPLFPDLEVAVVKPTGLGEVTAERVMELVTDKTDIVSIIHASNETGIINDVAAICEKVKQRNPRCLFHTDCAQTFCKVPTAFAGADAITLCLQKLGAPIGVTCLVLREGVEPVFECKPNVANGFGGSINMGLVEGAYRRLLEIQNFQQEIPTAPSYLTLFMDALRKRGVTPALYEDLILHAFECKRDGKPYELDRFYGKTTALFFALSDRRKQLQNLFAVAFFGFENGFISPYCKVVMQELLFEEHQVQIGLGSSCRNDNEKSYAKNSVLQAMEVPLPFRQSAIRVSFPWENVSVDEKKNKCELLADAVATVIADHSSQLSLRD